MSGLHCVVCDKQLTSQIHSYGGLCCFSCRSFFRRTVCSGMNKWCKLQGNCDITVKGGSKCIPCRYHKCLNVGLNPKLVKFKDGERIQHSDEKTQKFQNQTEENISTASSTILSVINQERLRSNNEEQNINIHNHNEEDEDIVEVSFIQETSRNRVLGDPITLDGDGDEDEAPMENFNYFNNYQTFQPPRASVIQLNPIFSHPTLR